jgi:cullin 1
MKTCEKALIQDHASLLREEFQVLLDNDRQSDLQRMYSLLSRIPDGLEPLRTKFEAHVRRAGLSAVDKIADGEENLEPKVYVDALLEVHTQYQNLVNTAFKGEAEFVRSLDNACREFVNRNKVCKSASTKSPELLAKYSDSLLRKSAKSAEEADLENKLTAIMTIFKYVEDKDVFQKFYSKMLAKRLVNFTSASDDAETSMIGKLKDACGFEYTNKLQRMFQDMVISKDLNDNYKTWLESKLDSGAGVDFSCQVLGTSFWPLNPPGTSFNIPDVIIQTYQRFVEFYNEKHNGRKLTWLWHLCKGDIKANYCKNTKVPYTFQVSTYQMAILLLFNDQTTISYEDIEKNVGLTKEYLDPALGVFLKAKVLTISPSGSKPGSGTQLSLNFDFKSKKIRVNLNMAVRAEQKQEVEETHKTIEEDRKLLMQASSFKFPFILKRADIIASPLSCVS